MMNCFASLAAFKILSLSFSIFIIIYLNMGLWVYPTWSLVSFLDVYIYVIHQIWAVFSHYLFKWSLCPFSLPFLLALPQCICWFFCWCLTSTLFCVYFSSVFFVYSSDLIISIALSSCSLILLSAQTYFLNPSDEFFIFVMHFSVPEFVLVF